MDLIDVPLEREDLYDHIIRRKNIVNGPNDIGWDELMDNDMLSQGYGYVLSTMDRNEKGAPVNSL